MKSSIRGKVMSKRDADIRVRIQRIARRIVSDVDSGTLRDLSPDLEDMLYKVQSAAISLSVSTSELIGLMKRQDPEYAAAVDAMENSPDEELDESNDAVDGPYEAESGESDEQESEDEKD